MKLFTHLAAAALVAANQTQDEYEDYGEFGEYQDPYAKAVGMRSGGPTSWNGMTARELQTATDLDANEGPSVGLRAAKFKETGGYVVIEKAGNCWEECGRKKGWSGFCSFCSLSNGSPGFCCNPRSQGGCSAGMVKAVRSSQIRSKNHYQCVIPKTMDDNFMTHYTMLERKNCWSNCGRKRGWAGRCNYCGPNGYCCHMDGRGSCTKEMSQVLKDERKRGMRCIVPDTIKNDLRMETKLSSACRDTHKTECRTLGDYKNKGMNFAALVDCTRFFPAKTCVTIDKISINPNAKPICTTKITNFCASESNVVKTRFADVLSDPDFPSGGGGLYSGWNTFTKEFYEFIRPHWVAADLEDNTAACEAGVDITEGFGTDVLTVAAENTTPVGSDDVTAICGQDRADVATLKHIINQMVGDSANDEILGLPGTVPVTLTGKERAEQMMDAFTAKLMALCTCTGDPIDACPGDCGATNTAAGLPGGADVNEGAVIADLAAADTSKTDPLLSIQHLSTTAMGSPAFELFSLVIGTLDEFAQDTGAASADFPSSSADPAVSYKDTSLLNMPKTEFNGLVNTIKSGVTTDKTASEIQRQYQSLINMAGDASSTDQVFWNFLADDQSPVDLSTSELDAIALALSQADFADVPKGNGFCGRLEALNQILRNGILSDQEVDAIMSEINDHENAYFNVATLMEVTHFLETEDLTAADTSLSVAYPASTDVPPQTRPTSAQIMAAIDANWARPSPADGTGVYGDVIVDRSDPGNPVEQANFEIAATASMYYTIISQAITDGGGECDTDATCGDAFKTAVVALLGTDNGSPPPLGNAGTNAMQCTDDSQGAPSVYKDVMYDYLSKVETDLGLDFATWQLRSQDAECTEDAEGKLPQTTLDDATKTLTCRISTCIESMDHVTFSNPAGSACDNIKGCIMLEGDVASKTSFEAMCAKDDYKHGLNQVLTAVAVLDADPAHDLERINGLFGGEDTRDFGDLKYQNQAPAGPDLTTCPSDPVRRTMKQSIREQENRKRGIITGGFVVAGLEQFKAQQKFETQTVSWWDTTLAWTTTDFFNKPAKKPSFGGNRDFTTAEQPPSFLTFTDIMTQAVANHDDTDFKAGIEAIWDGASDESKAAYCTVDPCMACTTDVQGKVISIALPDGRTSSECVCPAITSDSNTDGTVDTPEEAATAAAEADPVELAQPIYAQVVLNYFQNWELSPASTDPITSDPIPAEKFRPDELECIAAALSDLPAPTGTSNDNPLSAAQYQTHTRGIVIEHLMTKMYAKNDIDLQTRVQGALDETQFRHNVYFVLETLYEVEKQIRADSTAAGTAEDPHDFSMLNNYHVEGTPVTLGDSGTVSDSSTMDWRHPDKTGNTAEILSTDYLTQILSGLGGFDPSAAFADGSPEALMSTAIQAKYDDIFNRASELGDCAFADKTRKISWICDERIEESAWQGCAAQQGDQCWVDIMASVTPCDADTATAETDDGSDTSSNCACDRRDQIVCKDGVQMLTVNSNWHWNNQNPLYGAYSSQYMMDMANWYSSGEGSSAFSAGGGTAMTQAEICALEQAIAASMGSGAAGSGGPGNFANMINGVSNYMNANPSQYSADFVGKVQAIMNQANTDGRQEELDWLLQTANGLSGNYANNWRGDAANGEGHGSGQYNELINLMDGMQNGGGWDILGGASGVDGFDSNAVLSIDNNGVDGVWSGFGQGDYDGWIADSLNQNTMGADWAAANTGDNSAYQAYYNNKFEWISTLSPPPPGPTQAPQTIGIEWEGVGKAIAPEDLEHATCLMDEQLKLIEEYFTANGVGASDAQLIKDAAREVLRGSADTNGNDDGVNWFQGTLTQIDASLQQTLESLAVDQPTAVAVSNAPEFATLLTQLQLMAQLGDPANKDQLDKDAFKGIDFNTIIPSGTTVDNIGDTDIVAATTQALTDAGVTDIASFDLEGNFGRTQTELQTVAGAELTGGAQPTASQVSVSATASVTVSVTASVTAAPGVSVTAAPGVSVTAAPVSVTAAPGVSVTAAPGVSVTAAPGVSVTAAPGVSVTAAPGVSVTAAPGVSVTAAPVSVTAAPVVPGVSVTAAPVVPGVSVTAAPVVPGATTEDGNAGGGIAANTGTPTVAPGVPAPAPVNPVPVSPPTGSAPAQVGATSNTPNGYGSMYGDPHILIKNPEEPAVCFDIHGMHMEILNVLSDFNTGLTVNSKLLREGKHIRMAELYIVTPKGDSIGLTEDGVTIINDDFAQTFSFESPIDVQRPDVLVVSEPGHKNDNVHIYILGSDAVGVTEFLIVRKRTTKHSMKFSIVNNAGLSHNLGGVVGQNLIPHDYHIDESGNIQLKDRVIESNLTQWNAEDECYKINDLAAAKFMGHSTRDFILETPFEKFHPAWVEAQLHEDVGPK